MGNLSRAVHGESWPKQESNPTWAQMGGLLVWLVAGVAAFLPFAFDTSPWNAVTLRVPGNQGNWWHVLVGAPFFLAYPMIWLRLRFFLGAQFLTAVGRRLIWGAAGLSMVGTTLVEAPFLLHLAGTSEWQRLAVLGLGFGIMAASVGMMWMRRRLISANDACVAGIDTAYLANAALCLVVYSGAAGNIGSRSGWLVSMILIWPMLAELIWIYFKSLRARAYSLSGRL